ncbi:hydrolase 1, exosortase A system-associated [Sphingosinicella sp. LY1275]|uniref:hydrolase 1, exosortase A system-associated n=1 Tax=Sphingosinicella sp. LY1275 TaxID=3095379 RepID=UPI002ADEA9A8|nr:hydrolase 1, exosortase A system-associated [Sphingosinicella sp. LY1275]MEA1013581.1 hydrolase 1, exosortase A system-associated [Sphingosinicella sp. LY1275]
MDRAMRRLMTFACEDATLGATLDDGAGTTGVLMVTGGSQTRIGSHRMYERLAAALAERGVPCFRFDRRGVGDSEGADPGFRGSGPDIAAATGAFRAARPGLERIVGFGLCDGATALALFGRPAGLDGLILANPWLVEAEAGRPAPAAIKRHYRDRLLSREGWDKILSGSISYRKLLKGILQIVRPAPPADLASETAAALAAKRLPLALILCRKDATAIAAEDMWNKPVFAPVRNGAPLYVETDSHTFARPGDEQALLEACLAALERLEA